MSGAVHMCQNPKSTSNELAGVSFTLKSHIILQQPWVTDSRSASGSASVQAFHADRAALAATILARQLESQQIRGIARPAQLMLEQSPFQSASQTPDGLDPDAAAHQASPAAAKLCTVNAEPSTERMWQPDEQLTSSTAQHDEPSQEKQPHSQLETNPELHPGLRSVHKEEEEAQQRSPPESAAAAPLLYTAQRQGQLKDSQERTFADGHQLQSELPTFDDAPVNTVRLSSASSSPDLHRHAPDSAQPRPVADSIRNQTCEVSKPCVSGRSTLLRPNHLPAPQADSAVSLPHSVYGRQMPVSTSADGQVHHDSEAQRGRASAQQANPKAGIWSRQQLGYEDSSEAIKADASSASHQGTDREGYAGPGQLVSQGPRPESQQEFMPTGARIDGRHPEQGTDTKICASRQQAHAVLLLCIT